MNYYSKLLLFKIALFLCFGLNTIFNKAQSQTKAKIFIGLSQSSIENNNEPYTSRLVYDNKFDFTRLTYGIKVSQNLNEIMALGLDISHTNGGSLVEKNLKAFDYGLNEVYLQYLNFTIDAQLNIYENAFFILGFNHGLLIKAHWLMENGFSPPDFKEIKDCKNLYKNLDRALVIGIGGQIKNFSITMKYQHGLSKILEDDKLRWISVSFGYEFQLLKK